VCKKLTQNIKYDFEFAYNDPLFFENAKSTFVTSIIKSATKNPMLIKFIFILDINVVDVCAKN